MSESPPLLEVRDLRVVYDGDRGAKEVLRGVNLRVDDGQILGLVGESGSGKSVLLEAILRLLRPPWRIAGGSVRFRGQNLATLDEKAMQAIRGKDLALALSNPRQHLNPILPVGRQLVHVLQAARPIPTAQALGRAIDLLRAVGIPDPVSRLQAYPHELSGGMCQRVILALATANAPRLLIVDEPTSGLDVTISVQILDLMRDAVRTLGSGLLVVSRDLGVVAHYCERVAVMRDGLIIEEASVQTFFDAPREAYSRRLIVAAKAALDGGAAAPSSSVKAEPVLVVERLVKRFPVKGGRTLTAVDDVSFTIGRGEALGLVGESGSGKTTVGRCVLRLLEPTEGTLWFAGQDVSHLSPSAFRAIRSRIQMVFQDPFDSLDPRQRIGDAIEEPLRLTRTIGKAERMRRVGILLDQVGVGAARAQLYPHQLSGGELQRVGIARAIATEPDLVVLDEPTSALDVSVRAEILNLLAELQSRLGISYLFISHDLTAVRRVCQRVAILYLGKLVEVGETEAIFTDPLHPYARALLSSVLYADPAQDRRPIVLAGEIPSPIDPPPGCALHTRCPMATEICARVAPPFEMKRPGRWLACHNVPAEAGATIMAEGNPA
jgi:oligopeptide/dipeptide ABC transporter ATP-binding protein